MSLNSGETLQPFKPLNQLIYDSAGNLIGIQNDRANGSDLRIGGGSGVDGTFATLVATTALKLNSGATFDLYNTADQTTNYERLRLVWTAGTTARIVTGFGGSGISRVLQVGVTNSAGFDSPAVYTQYRSTSAPFISHVGATISGTGVGTELALLGAGGSSGTSTIAAIQPTINQSGTAGYTAFDINPTETATGSGTKLLQRWAVGGTAVGQMYSSGLLYAVNYQTAGGSYGFSTAVGASADIFLSRDAADALALRRGTNAQTFRVYNTYTDASNYERFQIVAGASNTDLVTFQTGTGSPRPLRMYTTGTQDLQFGTVNLMRWTISTSGHLLAFADNTYDIGASGANRPRNVYIGGSTVIGAFHTVGVSTVATLPAAAGAARAQIFVSDSSVAAAGNFGAIVAGGGANTVPVYSDGTNWRIG